VVLLETRVAALMRALLIGALALAALHAMADDTPSADWRLDGQLTNVTQWHPHFRSPYAGANSLQADGPAEETTDVTLYAGWRAGRSTELWINTEVDQGFGLSNTLGVAGFPSGEAYKVGANRPYLRLPRAFVRHTVALGGGEQKVEQASNQFAGATTADNLVLTLGKFSAVDIFDTNTYAHDPRGDFLNWSIIDAGPFDYAADAWGYTFGAAAEWTHGAWTLRGGVFQLSKVPNGKVAGLHMRQHMLVAETEHRHEWNGHAGKLKLLVFSNRARMADYDDALALAAPTGDAPDVALVRRWQTRSGVALNAEQELSSELGVFARAGANDGRKEAYEFTEINRSLSAGFALKGARWSRAGDTVGAAFAVNQLSAAARNYFAAGGMGILIGDGQLDYAPERILETYYLLRLNPHVAMTLDFQHIVHPAYNADRGPVSVWGVRLHAEL
jgi:high affinity Mn2+ porin